MRATLAHLLRAAPTPTAPAGAGVGVGVGAAAALALAAVPPSLSPSPAPSPAPFAAAGVSYERDLERRRQAAHLVASVPLPPRGRVSVGFGLRGAHLVAARPAANALPSSGGGGGGAGAPLAPLLLSLGLPALLQAFTALLCERRVALCSRSVALLAPAAEALMSL